MKDEITISKNSLLTHISVLQHDLFVAYGEVVARDVMLNEMWEGLFAILTSTGDELAQNIRDKNGYLPSRIIDCAKDGTSKRYDIFVGYGVFPTYLDTITSLLENDERFPNNIITTKGRSPGEKALVIIMPKYSTNMLEVAESLQLWAETDKEPLAVDLFETYTGNEWVVKEECIDITGGHDVSYYLDNPYPRTDGWYSVKHTEGYIYWRKEVDGETVYQVTKVEDNPPTGDGGYQDMDYLLKVKGDWGTTR